MSIVNFQFSIIMKQFIAFVKKEFFHIFRDRRTLLILLGMPVVQILLFGFAINMDVQNVRTIVYTPSHDETTADITQRIASNPNIDFKGEAFSFHEVESMIRKGEVEMAVIFDADFNANLTKARKAQIQILTDASDPNIGTISANYIMAIIGEYQQEMTGISRIPYQIDVKSRLLYNSEMKSAYTFVPGIMGLVLMIICTIMTSISIVREKERGTMEVLLASPLKPATVLISKTIPYLALSFINLITILLLSVFVLDVPIRGNIALLISVSTLYIFLALSLGLLISTMVRTQVVAVIVSGIGMIMPLLILSGMIFPIDNMPQILRALSVVIPARWFIEAIRKIMIEGLGFYHVWKEVVILCGMTALLVVLSIRNIKIRLQ